MKRRQTRLHGTSASGDEFSPVAFLQAADSAATSLIQQERSKIKVRRAVEGPGSDSPLDFGTFDSFVSSAGS